MRCAGHLLQAFEAKGLFGHMTETQRAQVYELMTPRTITPGTELMKQGDNGDTYFVIESGTADVYVHGQGEVREQFSQSLLSRADHPQDMLTRCRCRRAVLATWWRSVGRESLSVRCSAL